MKAEIKTENAMPLLGRREIKGTIVFDQATPSNDSVRKELAGLLKAPEELVVTKHIYTYFGRSAADFLVYTYNTKEDMDRFEPKKKQASETKKEDTPASKSS